MMINKRLIGTVKESKKYIGGTVACNWVSLAANIVLMGAVANVLQTVYIDSADKVLFGRTAAVAGVAMAVRLVCALLASRMSYLSSKAVKKVLREQIYQKLLCLGTAYREQVQTSEVVQVAVEGVDQLETYFGAYLPQFFYAMLAPLTLFAVLSLVDLPSAAVLLICVPLIPITIVAVQRLAKKLLGKYWGQYTALGDTFLENLQGLTTAKIYNADERKHREMNEQGERFRKITMKVLTMQLNSISVMDLIAYGGAALGMILATLRLRGGYVDLRGCLLIILLAADFFLPMRRLGSFFHIAMNGMAASDKIFHLLDLPEQEKKDKVLGSDCCIELKGVHFAYEAEREILRGIEMSVPAGSFTALVGESGSGKSTVAALLTGKNKGYSGMLTVGGVPLAQVSEESLSEHITYVSHHSYLFKGTVRDNLLMAKPNGTDEELWAVLEQVNLVGFLRGERGLDTLLAEKASNLSGGQCQRLALARALLHDSPVYIFDEATSNIDVESENDIIREIHRLAKTKTVILISHRLANTVNADQIYVLDKGAVAERGSHSELLAENGVYARLWNAQRELECYAEGGSEE